MISSQQNNLQSFGEIAPYIQPLNKQIDCFVSDPIKKILTFKVVEGLSLNVSLEQFVNCISSNPDMSNYQNIDLSSCILNIKQLIGVLLAIKNSPYLHQDGIHLTRIFMLNN